MAKKSFGLYQYSLELEIQDATVQFVAQKYMRLLDKHGALSEYINLLNIPRIYNRARSGVDLGLQYRTTVLPVIREYFRVLLDFRIVKRRKMRQMARQLQNITNPSTRSSQGIHALDRLVSDLLTSLERTIDSVSSSVITNIPNPPGLVSSTRTSSSATAKRTFTIRKTFFRVFDSETPKNIGGVGGSVEFRDVETFY